MAIERVAGETIGVGQVTEQQPLETDISTPVEEHIEQPRGAEEQPQPLKKMTVRESIEDAIAQASKPGERGEPQQQGQKKPGAQEVSTTATPGTQPQALEPPDAWKSKEWKPLWDAMSPQVRAAITKRETDMQNGVRQLQQRYSEIDGVIAPNRDRIRQFGFTEAQAIDQMFKWQGALAGPDKVRAFVALMQSHGLDPSTFAAAVMQTGGGATPQPTQGDIHPEVRQALEAINNKLGQYDQRFTQQTSDAAQQTVLTWAKDKPHFDKVKVLMGQLINAGVVKPSENDPFALDAAYSMAIHANDEVRAEVAAEERKKADAARKAVNDKARKAGSSMRTGAPVPPANGAAQQDNRNESARQSITRALAELRGQ